MFARPSLRLASWSPIATLFVLLAASSTRSACVDNSTDTAGLQKLLTDGGEGYTLSLCAGQVYSITQSLNFTDLHQVSGSKAPQ